MSSWQAQEEGTAAEELLPSDWLMGMPEGTFSWLLIVGGWSIPPWSVPLWAGGPGLYKEAAEEKQEASQEAVSSGVSVSSPCPGFP